MKQRQFLVVVATIFTFLSILQKGFTEDLTSMHQTSLNLVDRLARLEEGQKSIKVEMRTRFESIEKRFESIDKRFESIDKRFESIEKRFESLDNRFESLDNRFELLERLFEKRFESIDKRIDALASQVAQQGSYNLAMLAAILGLMGYVIWDRKTAMEKALSATYLKMEHLFQTHIEKYHPEPVEQKENNVFYAKDNVSTGHRINDEVIIPNNIKEKFRDIINFMNQFPDMRSINQPA
jgi:chaperonin cofactor prefoldin